MLLFRISAILFISNMSSAAVPYICKSLTAILKLKLSERFNDKYNTIIMHLCDALIVNDSEDQLYKIIRMICESLRAALEYKTNLNSNYYNVTSIKYSKGQMENFKDELEKHLNHFNVFIEPYNVKYLRLDTLVKCNCEALQELFLSNVSDGFIEWYNVLIKFISHALYEILEWRMVRRYNIRFDVLMKLNAQALKEILELKITAMESAEEFDPDDKSRRTEYLLHKMHTDLLQEINYYLQA